MKIGLNGGQLDEPALVKLYMDLTGSSESGARSVIMHVCFKELEKTEFENSFDIEALSAAEPVWPRQRREISTPKAQLEPAIGLSLLQPTPQF